MTSSRRPLTNSEHLAAVAAAHAAVIETEAALRGASQRRAVAILAAQEAGVSTRIIAKHIGVTPQRIAQLRTGAQRRLLS